MVKVQGLSISQVCKDMKLGESAVRRPIVQLEAEQRYRQTPDRRAPAYSPTGGCENRQLRGDSRKIIGWAMAREMPASLVCAALQMAIVQRKPKAGLIVHSDRGSQYASGEHQVLLQKHGLVGSMSRKGNCWADLGFCHNAVMERFFLNLKMERVWQKYYANHSEAMVDVADYIVGFYNCQRVHSTLGNLSPNARRA